MKRIVCMLILSSTLAFLYCQEKSPNESRKSAGVVQNLEDTLSAMAERSDNVYFKNHCQAIISVIHSKVSLTAADTNLLKVMFDALNNGTVNGNAKLLQSYLDRKRPFILAWVSPTDGKVSFSWLKLPKDWDPEETYPMYIELHGLWSVADPPIEYMTYPFRQGASSSYAWEDGYLLSPWGRGNLWYQGISETDILECMDALEAEFNIDPKRRYLCGHSMGGYGAWAIASKYPEIWAALGIHAGALWYDNSSLVNESVASVLSSVPTYFVCGTSDGLLSINQEAYSLLNNAGNSNTEFVTFNGGHDYIQENVENMYDWMHEFINTDWYSSLEQNASDNTVELYPNPASTELNIHFMTELQREVKIELITESGCLVYMLRMQTEKGNNTFSFILPENLLDGIYFIRITAGEKAMVNKVLIRSEL